MRPARLLLCALLLTGCDRAAAPDPAPQASPPAAAGTEAPVPAGDDPADAEAGPRGPVELDVTLDAVDPDAVPATVPTANGLLESVARADDTLASLRARYGAENVVEQDLPAGEGNTLPGWVLFPGRPDRQLAVHLDETGEHPAMLIAGAEVTEWQRADGVRNGITVAELEAINGRPFRFMGFYWEFGGVVIDWKGGRLGPDGSVPGPVMLCAPEFVDGDLPEGWPTGDGEFASDLPVLSTFPPVVCEFGLVLQPPPA